MSRRTAPKLTAPEAAAQPGDDPFDRAREDLRPDKALRDPDLKKAAALLGDDRTELAEPVLRAFLRKHPRNPDALHLMAEAASKEERHSEAEALLAKAVALAPDFPSARFNYANALLRENKGEAALGQLEILLRKDPHNPLFRRLRAKALDSIAKHAEAAACWRELVGDYPERPDCWIGYGHALRSLGRQEECVAAYRRALALRPSCGDAYWSLANLKTFRFAAPDIEGMEAALARAGLASGDRVALHFSLGKAHGDLGAYEKSFENYARGNALFRVGVGYDPDVTTEHVARCKALFTRAFFAEREGAGCRAADPIFIVGMPRSGSTLVEQILSTHSAIEGTAELPDIPQLARRLELRAETEYDTDYPGVLAKLDRETLRGFGERYLDSTRTRRKLGRPFFIDKMLSNALHVPLIHLILPNARIVDVRRHPLACCFSNFTQHFGAHHLYTYRLAELGKCYRDYADAMAHFDRVLPGKVHRVFYERLVADPETEIRRLLANLGLPFEAACLDFHRTGRVVTTASSEQVRTPLYRDALERWRNYEPWLGPLKSALGPAAGAYPGAPASE